MSMVPPVNARPRPDTLGTANPHAAAKGTTTSEVLSPTPPVLCLSTAGADRDSHDNVVPLATNALVSADASVWSIPLRQTAISHADI